MLLAILLSVAAPSEYRLEVVRQSLTGTHCRYREYVSGIPTENYETRPCSEASDERGAMNDEQSRGAVHRSSFIAHRSQYLWSGGRLLRREIAGAETLKPVAEDYDAATGELVRRIPLYYNAKPARVFDPSPVVTLNHPGLQDRNDSASAVPEAAYRDVELERTEDFGPLRGTHVTLVDRQLPDIEPPDAAGSLVFDREQDGFEDVNAYFHIDRNQQYLQSLGYRGERAVVAYSIETDTHAGAGFDNSFFQPSVFTIGTGTLFFGEGGTDDAEDADLLVHEYGHAILEWISPGTFSGTFSTESRALGEGFGDYWAFSAHRAQRVASGRDPYCFADWDARCWEDETSQQCGYPPGSDCLRRLDTTRTMADYERQEAAGTEHRNGTIWSSALREIHEQLGRETTDTIVIESLFGAPPNPTFAAMAQRLIETDRLLNNGTHAGTICSAMTARGILTGCDIAPRGETTLFQSNARGVAIPENSEGITSAISVSDPRTIERLQVRVDIVHPARGDLRLELIAPDGTTVLLKQISLDRAADIHATYGLTSNPVASLDIFRGRSATGVWTLVVKDLQARDIGTLVSWGLVLQFAGDTPVTGRPRHARAQMVPVVTHVYGTGPRLYVSDVRIANVQATPETATLIFTRSGENGLTSFSTANVNVEPGQTVAFEDVVANTFHTAGSGTLEVLGDVVVMSRTYFTTAEGTLGQQVPPNLQTTSVTEATMIVDPFVAPDAVRDDRINFGIAETAGGSGVVHLRSRGEDRDIPIEPFSHVLLPIDAYPSAIDVVSGDARVAAYISQLDLVTKDPMFIPAQTRGTPAPRALIAPFINNPSWQSAVWYSDTSALIEHISFATGGIGAVRVTPKAGAFAGTRIRHGGTHQYVPLLPAEGPREQHLLFIENSPGYRTNIGIVSDRYAQAEVTVYDAAGNELQTGYLETGGGVHQFMVFRPIVNGRARVRFLFGHGRAYASMIDTGTGDATYVQDQ
ncbi:MAG TPA: proprotein convertase P-domain-containing protein [Thermoanaerobaculia bacterium]|nr:proprotein convertase P-domain-containing protein [Thermoanaerobaculia bacterium]